MKGKRRVLIADPSTALIDAFVNHLVSFNTGLLDVRKVIRRDASSSKCNITCGACVHACAPVRACMCGRVGLCACMHAHVHVCVAMSVDHTSL